ncbi:MAG: UDP-2,4-diacetamido-2,4,6-trideoxy-beta-L-altropyranose hydrolase [Pseudomonadota bacterium]
MRVAIRADASSAIGTGHIHRMLSLARVLKAQGAQVLFVTRPLGMDTQKMITSGGFDVALLSAPCASFEANAAIPHSHWAKVSQDQDSIETIALLKKRWVDRVVVDHYAFDRQWHNRVEADLETPTMVIDDLADRPLGGCWIVDQNYHPDHMAKFEGKLKCKTVLLAGPSYSMLDPRYADAPRYRFSESVRSVGVFMGGVDARHDTLSAIDALDAAGWNGPLEVVVTRHTHGASAVERRLAQWPHATVSRDLPNLAEFFARHDLQIGAGGGAVWERCCIGAPTIGLVCAANQAESIPYANAAGFLIGIDFMSEPDRRRNALVKAIGLAISQPRKRATLSANARRLVDGRGAERLAIALMMEG